MVILFVFGLFFLGEVRGFFDEFWWWSVLLNLGAAIALGFVGLTIMYVLYKDRKINASPFVISVFAFSFAVATGALWEIFEFSVDKIFGFTLQKPGFDTMLDVIANTIGAFLVSTAGYFYIKKGKIIFVSSLIERFIEKNPKLFKSQNAMLDASDEVLKLIKKGEDSKLEFKSTLRTNLHTNEIDKRMEHAVMKTIVGYLNSEGGTLLVGVSDTGEIIGTEKDNFSDIDKLNLHFTNLIKEHIGSEFLSYVQHQFVNVNGKSVLKVDCIKSNKHVFLRIGKDEEFYVRNGPQTVPLTGSSLINYIANNFSHNFK